MEVLVFDLVGKMAHFRKYYTNSSSLSYYFPPRTVITGTIAGIIGKKRDDYYDLFSSDNSRIAVSIKTPLRKIQQTINYVWAENIKQLNLSKGQHTQIPVEIVLPLKGENIIYRIFFWHKNKEIFNKVKESVMEHKFIFPPYLGISEFIGDIKFVDSVEAEEITSSEVEIDSVLNVDYLSDGTKIPIKKNDSRKYVKEKMPLEFNSDRTLKSSPKEFIVELSKGKILLEANRPILKVSHKEGEENILFMVKR